MSPSIELFMPILFKVLLGFISLNIVINLILLFTQRRKLYKLLSFFWPAVLFMFFCQSMFQEGELPILYAFSASFISLTIFATLGFEAIGKKIPWKKYVLLFTFSYVLSYVLYLQDYSFTIFAMPIAVAAACPMMHAFYLIHVTHRSETTRLQKVLGVMYVVMSVHCINFAVFRMDQDTQLWGWLVAYAIYDTLAILLPSIALEKANMSENERLLNLVKERTEELNSSLNEKDHLLKVLLHDISNPLMVSRFYLTKIEVSDENKVYLDRVHKCKVAIENIIQQVKGIYGQKYSSGQISLKPVSLEDCINEISFLFSQKLESKNISLSFTNKLSPHTNVLAEKISLTHSVLSNIISNGVKFSRPNSKIHISAEENNGTVVLEIKDQGPGISKDIVDGLMNESTIPSTLGTEGEGGSGFGLSIAKSFVDSYGGQIEFNPKYITSHPLDHGTSIRIVFDQA